MYNPRLYDEISQDVADRYNKDKHSNELLSVQNFLDSITNNYIKNKKDALEKFKTIKNNVKSENLKDIVKKLERAIFGYDYDNDNEEPKYEKSIAERTKMRRQNKETDKKDESRTFAPPDSDSDDSDKLTEQTEKVYEEGVVMMVLGITSGGLIKTALIKMGITSGGLMKMALIKMGMTIWGLIKMALIKMGMTSGGLMKMDLMKMGKKVKNVINLDIT